MVPKGVEAQQGHHQPGEGHGPLHCVQPAQGPVERNVVVEQGKADGLYHQAPEQNVEYDVPSDLAWEVERPEEMQEMRSLLG